MAATKERYPDLSVHTGFGPGLDDSLNRSLGDMHLRGRSGPDCLADFARRHELTNDDCFCVLYWAAEMIKEFDQC